MKQDYEVLKTDVLVIGGGMAGLSAAIRAKDLADNVILVEKGNVTRSGVSMFCHAFGAPVPKDLVEPLMKSYVERGGFVGDQARLEIILNEIGERVRDMEKWGVIFQRDEKGNLKLGSIRGWKIKANALAEGKQLIEAMAKEALRKGVKFVERVAITDLLTSDGNLPTAGHVVGAVGIETRTGQFIAFESKAVVIATGGISAKLHSAYMDNVTGDGHAIAFRAGAEIGGMEFSPTFHFAIWNRKFCTGGSGEFQHEGARLINRLGEEFLPKYPTASKDSISFEGQDDQGDLSRAIAVEYIEGRGPVYFDIRGWSQEKIAKMRKVLPFAMMAFDEAGVMKEQRVQTTPMPTQYSMSCQSGLKVNSLGETTIGGLYAAGAACMYGKGPLPQAASAVAGYQTGEQAAKRGRDAEFGGINRDQVARLRESVFLPLRRVDGISPENIYLSVNKAVTPIGAGLFKHEKRIIGVLAELRRIAGDDLTRVKANDIHQLVKANEARSFIQLMELYNVSALERKESRMAHYREDYPYTDNQDWLKWVLVKNNGRGGIDIKVEPIPLGGRAIKPDVSKIPSPIQFRIERP